MYVLSCTCKIVLDSYCVCVCVCARARFVVGAVVIVLVAAGDYVFSIYCHQDPKKNVDISR